MDEIQDLYNKLNQLSNRVCCISSTDCTVIQTCLATLAGGNGNFIITNTSGVITLTPSSGGGSQTIQQVLTTGNTSDGTIPWIGSNYIQAVSTNTTIVSSSTPYPLIFVDGNNNPSMQPNNGAENSILGFNINGTSLIQGSGEGTAWGIVQLLISSPSTEAGISLSNTSDDGLSWSIISTGTGSSIGTGLFSIGNGGFGMLTLHATGEIDLPLYGSGTFTGTPTYNLAVTSTGEIIEVPIELNSLTGNSTTPTITAGAGAGTGPTVSIVGTNIGFQVTVTTGTGVLPANTTLCTITYDSLTFPTGSIPVYSPANNTASSLNGAAIIKATGTPTTTIFTTGNTGLITGLTYIWNVVVTGY